MHLHWHFPTPEILAWSLICGEIMFYEFSMDFSLKGAQAVC